MKDLSSVSIESKFCKWISKYSSINCWKQHPFSFELPFLLCQRSVDFICVGWFLGYYVPLICLFLPQCYAIFITVALCLEVKKCQFSNFILFSIVSAILSLLPFHIKFKISLLYVQNNLLTFWFGLCWIYRSCWEGLVS